MQAVVETGTWKSPENRGSDTSTLIIEQYKPSLKFRTKISKSETRISGDGVREYSVKRMISQAENLDDRIGAGRERKAQNLSMEPGRET